MKLFVVPRGTRCNVIKDDTGCIRTNYVITRDTVFEREELQETAEESAKTGVYTFFRKPWFLVVNTADVRIV